MAVVAGVAFLKRPQLPPRKHVVKTQGLGEVGDELVVAEST